MAFFWELPQACPDGNYQRQISILAVRFSRCPAAAGQAKAPSEKAPQRSPPPAQKNVGRYPPSLLISGSLSREFTTMFPPRGPANPLDYNGRAFNRNFDNNGHSAN